MGVKDLPIVSDLLCQDIVVAVQFKVVLVHEVAGVLVADWLLTV